MDSTEGLRWERREERGERGEGRGEEEWDGEERGEGGRQGAKGEGRGQTEGEAALDLLRPETGSASPGFVEGYESPLGLTCFSL